MDELDKIIEKLEIIQQFYGIGGVLFILILSFTGIALWKFLLKRTEKIAEEITAKNLKSFQSEIDKGLVKFSTKHQKQVDAVQDCYQKFQELQSFVNFMINGEKFTAQMNPEEEVKHISTYRLEFKRSYKRNRILFPVILNEKIESLLTELDTFIEDYINGLMPTMYDDNIPDEHKSEYQIAGIWALGKLESTLEKMEEINKEIELEFRKIYGTDDK